MLTNVESTCPLIAPLSRLFSSRMFYVDAISIGKLEVGIWNFHGLNNTGKRRPFSILCLDICMVCMNICRLAWKELSAKFSSSSHIFHSILQTVTNKLQNTSLCKDSCTVHWEDGWDLLLLSCREVIFNFISFLVYIKVFCFVIPPSGLKIKPFLSIIEHYIAGCIVKKN